MIGQNTRNSSTKSLEWLRRSSNKKSSVRCAHSAETSDYKSLYKKKLKWNLSKANINGQCCIFLNGRRSGWWKEPIWKFRWADRLVLECANWYLLSQKSNRGLNIINIICIIWLSILLNLRTAVYASHF